MKVLRVPKQAISVEYLLSKAGIDSKNRADIVVWYYEPNDGYWYALGVIECKAPDVDIMTEEVKEQVFGYADDLLVDYVVVVNGVYSCCWLYDNKDGYKNLLKKLPEYQKMIDKDVEFDDYYKTPERFKFEELEANKYNLINERSILGEKTNPDRKDKYDKTLFRKENKICKEFPENIVNSRTYRYGGVNNMGSQSRNFYRRRSPR